MKKLALIITLFTAIGTNAFAQDGYVDFFASHLRVWDEFTSPGTGVVAPGDVNVTFLWALVGTPDPLGAVVPITGVSSMAGGWNTVSSMISSGWNIAVDDGTGAEADVADTANGIQKGEIDYNNDLSFALAGSTGGDTYEIVVIGWDNQTGATTLGDGMAGDLAMGWSNEFEYTTGTTNTSPISNFTDGMNAFGVAPVPEPATFALAGLGGLAMLLLRRRNK